MSLLRTFTLGLGQQRTSARGVLCWLARTIYERKENTVSMGVSQVLKARFGVEVGLPE